MKDYLDFLKAKGLAASTVETRKRHLFYFFEYLWNCHGITEIRCVTPSLVRVYQRDDKFHKAVGNRRQAGPGELCNRLTAVKDYFKFLERRHLVLQNPCVGLVFPRREKLADKDVPNEREVAALLETPNITSKTGLRDRAILEILYSSGLRQGEVVNLDVGDMDLAAGLVRVRRGKGKRDRVVPVGRVACDFAARYLREVRPLWVVKGENQEALFLSQRRVRLKNLSQVVKVYTQNNFPGRKVTPHTFRHACATHLLRAGGGLRFVQEFLGHKCVTTTERYTHLTCEDLKAACRQSHPGHRWHPLSTPSQ